MRTSMGDAGLEPWERLRAIIPVYLRPFPAIILVVTVKTRVWRVDIPEVSTNEWSGAPMPVVWKKQFVTMFRTSFRTVPAA